MNLSLIKELSGWEKLHRVYRYLKGFQSGVERHVSSCSSTDITTLETLSGWVNNHVSERLSSVSKAYPEDAAVLVRLICEEEDASLDRWYVFISVWETPHDRIHSRADE